MHRHWWKFCSHRLFCGSLVVIRSRTFLVLLDLLILVLLFLNESWSFCVLDQVNWSQWTEVSCGGFSWFHRTQQCIIHWTEGAPALLTPRNEFTIVLMMRRHLLLKQFGYLTTCVSSWSASAMPGAVEDKGIRFRPRVDPSIAAQMSRGWLHSRVQLALLFHPSRQRSGHANVNSTLLPSMYLCLEDDYGKRKPPLCLYFVASLETLLFL